MIQKPANYDNAQAFTGEYERLTPGGPGRVLYAGRTGMVDSSTGYCPGHPGGVAGLPGVAARTA